MSNKNPALNSLNIRVPVAKSFVKPVLKPEYLRCPNVDYDDSNIQLNYNFTSKLKNFSNEFNNKNENRACLLSQKIENEGSDSVDDAQMANLEISG